MSRYIPNSYQTPNVIVDELISKMTDTEFKIYHVVVRNTTGWHREKTKKLTVKMICDILKKSKPTVIKGLSGLKELKLIKEHGQARTGFSYSVYFEIKGERKNKPMVKKFYQCKYDQWLKTLTINGKEVLPIMVKYFNHSNLYILNTDFKHIFKTQKKKEKDFSFSLKRDTHFDNVNSEYKQKLKAKLLLLCGDEKMIENFFLSLEAKASYKYKNFVITFKKWHRDLNYTPLPEPQLGKGWFRVSTNGKFYAINEKTLEIKIGSVKETSLQDPEPKQIQKRDLGFLKNTVRRF